MATQQTPTTSDYRDANLNIAFSYPSRWKIAKKDKREVRFEIPFATGTRSGELVVIRTSYRGAADDWQLLQKTTNELSNRLVVRQWTQDLLGAPLLMTQVNFDDRAEQMAMTTGLFYTNVPSKMLFHLKVPVSLQDQMAFEWQQTLESFRTLDGGNLASEDPSKPVTARPTVNTTAPKRPISDGKVTVGKVPAERRQEVTIAGRKLEVVVPQGWTISSTAEKTMLARNKGVEIELPIELALKVDSDPPEKWLAGVAAKDFANFSTVVSRDDAENASGMPGVTYGFTIRTGSTAQGFRWSGAAYATGTDAYVQTSLTGTNQKDYSRHRRALVDFLKSIEIKTLP